MILNLGVQTQTSLAAALILCPHLILPIYTPQSPGAAAVLPKAPPASSYGLRVPGALPKGLRGLQDRLADRQQRAGSKRQRQQVPTERLQTPPTR